MKSPAFVAMERKIQQAIREHEHALNEGIRLFNELSPAEQMKEQLRKWQALLDGSWRND